MAQIQATPRIAIPEWQILGPFPNTNRESLLANGLENESALAPSHDAVNGKHWQVWPVSQIDFLDPAMRLDMIANCFVYAATSVLSLSEQDAVLWVGSDDGVAIWVNGQSVHWHDTSRMVIMASDRVPVRLHKGWNLLLFKVSQGGGGWGLVAHIETEAGATDIGFSTHGVAKINPAGIAAAVGPGAIDLGGRGSKSATIRVNIRNELDRHHKTYRVDLLDGDAVLGAVDAGKLTMYGIATPVIPLQTATFLNCLAQGRRPVVRVTSPQGQHIEPCPEPVILSVLLDCLSRASAATGKAAFLKTARDLVLSVRELGATLDCSGDLARQVFAAFAAGRMLSIHKTAEAMLAQCRSLAKDRSGQTITLVGHAHIDMNWLWELPETRKVAHDTFRQVLAFMKEFSAFTFSQSQSSVYQMIEEMDPAMFKEIRRYVKEGRWELLGGMVDEGDTNLSGGEALVRSFLYGQRYFLSRFGKLAKVGWLPDNFGHVGQLPQIMQLAGISAFYAHRCQPTQGLSVWEGIDGTRVLNYATPTYNGEVSVKLHDAVEQYDARNEHMMWVYGVGDHGGGPARGDIERALSLGGLPGFPTIEFGTATEFFNERAAHAADYPVHRGELQYTFRGCYTSIARIKEGNRRCENTLYLAELAAAMATLSGFFYPRERLRSAWGKVAFNQFHDILCGSATHESNRQSVGVYDEAHDIAQGVLIDALRHVAAQVPTKANRGQPVVVFNPLPGKQSDVVEVELFSYTEPSTARIGHWGVIHDLGELRARTPEVTPMDQGQGAIPAIQFETDSGKRLDAQIVAGSHYPNGYRMKVQFLAADVPGGACRVFYARPAEGDLTSNRMMNVKGTVIETQHLLVEWSETTGHLTRLYDKGRKVEVLKEGAGANALVIHMEEAHGMSSWNIGKFVSETILDKPVMVRVTEQGPVRACVESWYKWGQSTFIQRMYVYRDLGRVDFDLEAHWFERALPWESSPMLSVRFPLNMKDGRFVCETPFAALERADAREDVPALRWVDLSNESTGGVALLNSSKYGFRHQAGVIDMSVLRASNDPDPYPDLGIHHVRYSLVPHSGDWLSAGIAERALLFNSAMPAIETPPGQKAAKQQAGFVLQSNTCVLDGIKLAEDDGDWVVRFHEAAGKAGTVKLTLPKSVRRAIRTDLLEQPLVGATKPVVAGRTVTLRVKPHEILTVKVRM